MILDRTSRDLNIVERDGVICELLIIFVPLAGDQDNVARACQLNGAINGLSAIDNFFIVSRSKSLFDFGDDRVRIFFARSEERRVGKECRSGVAWCPVKKLDVF